MWWKSAPGSGKPNQKEGKKKNQQQYFPTGKFTLAAMAWGLLQPLEGRGHGSQSSLWG